MLRKAWHYLQDTTIDTIYPRFSELDALTLVYALSVTGFISRKPLIQAFLYTLRGGEILNTFWFGLGAFVAIYCGIMIARLALSNRRASRSTKLDIAVFFYFSVAALTIGSFLATPEWISAARTPTRAHILIFVQILSILRAIMALALLKNTKQGSFLGSRFHDYQTTFGDILVIAISVPFFYRLGRGYDPASIVLISYFYPLVLISLFHTAKRYLS